MANILVVDDQKDICRVIERILQKEGHKISIAADGREGGKIFDEGTFDLLITDLIMPEMDGIELIMQIKKQKPDQNIIAMSGGGIGKSDSYLNIAAKLGVAHTIEKPFRANDLLKVVHEII
jgi:DNA-binding NtrC family response regulator